MIHCKKYVTKSSVMIHLGGYLSEANFFIGGLDS
jgi:hypothetical protein